MSYGTYPVPKKKCPCCGGDDIVYDLDSRRAICQSKLCTSIRNVILVKFGGSE